MKREHKWKVLLRSLLNGKPQVRVFKCQKEEVHDQWTNVEWNQSMDVRTVELCLLFLVRKELGSVSDRILQRRVLVLYQCCLLWLGHDENGHGFHISNASGHIKAKLLPAWSKQYKSCIWNQLLVYSRCQSVVWFNISFPTIHKMKPLHPFSYTCMILKKCILINEGYNDCFKKYCLTLAIWWRPMPLIPVIRGQSQADLWVGGQLGLQSEFQRNLVLKSKTKNKGKERKKKTTKAIRGCSDKMVKKTPGNPTPGLAESVSLFTVRPPRAQRLWPRGSEWEEILKTHVYTHSSQRALFCQP